MFAFLWGEVLEYYGGKHQTSKTVKQLKKKLANLQFWRCIN